MIDGNRPSPDELLNQIEIETQKAHRGRLKIFFGSSAGVGKTYSMLSAAQELHKQGVDIVVGILETHGRPNTEALVKGLPTLEPLMIRYRGLVVREFNLQKALETKPHTILIDELAHTNAPGLAHPKRWNDVLELLEAGINVFTTLNVQHIESLSDLVAGTTGVWVKETVPDSVFDMADDIVLVDIDTDDLIKRLHEGNVYIAPDANKRAADNFFRKDNLNALREIALRRTAERVDAERGILHETTGRLPVSERLLVCIAADPGAAKLIRSTKRIATALKAPWTALYVEKGDPRSKSNIEKRRIIEMLERMVARLDGKMVTLHGDFVLDEIMSYAQKNNVTKILVGKEYKLSIRNYFKTWLVDRIIQKSRNIDVIVITEEATQQQAVPQQSSLADLKPFSYLLAFLTAACMTMPGLFLPNILTGTDQALLYLSGIVMVAEMLGLGPALFYALMAALAFNMFFATNHSFHPVNDRAYLMTFIVMLVTGYAIATQSSRLKTQAIAARDKEEQTRALYDLSRKLASTRGRFPVAEVVSSYLIDHFDINVSIWMINAEGHPSVVLGNLPQDTYYKDFGALQWCYDNAKNAGLGTATLPNAAGIYIPLITSTGTIGVLACYPKQKERLFTSDEISSMETMATLLASALDRVRAGEIAQQITLERENKKLRETLMTAISQDNTRANDDSALSQAYLSIVSKDTGSIVTNPVDLSNLVNLETEKLKKKVTHLLDASSLEIGSLEPTRMPASIIDCVEASIRRLLPGNSKTGPFRLSIPADLPDVLIDRGMIEQLFINVLDNAMRSSPHGSHILVEAERLEGEVITRITDLGDAYPPHMHGEIVENSEKSILDMLATPDDLALGISAGIARLHDGRLWTENLSPSGRRLCFTLPLA